jgi:transposase
MDHCAIDLGGRESQVCIRAADGRVRLERRVPTTRLGKMLEKEAPCRVVMETCAEAFAIADQVLSLGHEVRVVPSGLSKTLGVGAHGVKTDVRDARVLSEVSTRIDLPSVHVASHTARERKTLCGMRDALVSSRTQLINTVRGWMRTQLLAVKSGQAESFPTRVRALGTPDRPLPSYVLRQLDAIDQLTSHVLAADKDLAALAKRDPTCPRLMSVPGVGPITAVRFVAALDTIARFTSAAQVQSYLGLTPGENSSSNRQRRTGITKAGPAALRATLLQAAWSARRARGKHPMHDWVNEVEKRRGKRVAVVALARKLAGILFALWRDGTFYDARSNRVRPNPPQLAAAVDVAEVTMSN